MKERLLWKYAASLINYKRLFSFRKWCKLKNVPIYSDVGGKKLYVLKEDFEMAANHHDVLSQKDKQTFGQSELESKLKLVSQLRQAIDEGKPVSRYRPIGENESKFLSSLTANETRI
jgi:hypothetical protein